MSEGGIAQQLAVICSIQLKLYLILFYFPSRRQFLVGSLVVITVKATQCIEGTGLRTPSSCLNKNP